MSRPRSRKTPVRALSTALGYGVRGLQDITTTPLRAGLPLRTPGPLMIGSAGPVSGHPARGQAILSGEFSFGGHAIDTETPWTTTLPTPRFARWLHGFDWMDDVYAIAEKSPDTAPRALELVTSWVEAYGRWNAFCWAPDLTARRLFHWLSLWSPLLEGAPDSVRTSVVRQLRHLRVRPPRPGVSRLEAACVFCLAGARLPEGERWRDLGADKLADELQDQIHPDGGHVSRNPIATLDVLDRLRRVDAVMGARNLSPPPQLHRAMDRIRPMIGFFTHADGGLAAFQGGGEGDWGRIGTLMGDGGSEKTFAYAPHTGYHRIARGREDAHTLVIVDTGDAAPAPHDAGAHLSPLAIEIGTAAGRLIVGCAWSDGQPLRFRRPVRETAAHSTLTVAGASAGRFDRPKSGRPAGISRGVAPISATRRDGEPGSVVDATHSGYVDSYGLSHTRRIFLSANGRDIRGEDILGSPLGRLDVSTIAPGSGPDWTLRFHLHPDVRAELHETGLRLGVSDQVWTFLTDAGPVQLEESVYLGSGHIPSATRQIVVRGHVEGETHMRWAFKRIDTAPSASAGPSDAPDNAT